MRERLKEVENEYQYVMAEDHSDTSSNSQEFAVVMRRLPSDRFLDQMVMIESISLSDIPTVVWNDGF